ncbi:MAG: serine/threonine protein kinase [Lentisphaerae bacterium]|jgi:serine/threonine-protein kinase|nr:serine/threonine protein kinase [Lentisphaerota bacterium]
MMTPPEIEGFEISGLLGQGGMATVWKARQLSLDRMVAIKVLSPRFAVDPEEIRRFCEEARATANLSHKGIVQVYDATFANGLYFVMEFIDGYTMGQWQRRKGSIGVADALIVAENVATALDYAWKQHGLIHCDIKPDNIMVDADGTVKVADMGLARTYTTMGGDCDDVLGTPNYMPPEQVQGKELDCRADIYALGASLYHMISGRLLFDGDPHDVMAAHMERQAPSIRFINSDVPVPVTLMIEKMLSKFAADRQQDWLQVLADVKRVEKNQAPAGVSADCVSSMGRDAETESYARSLGKKIVWKKPTQKKIILRAP